MRWDSERARAAFATQRVARLATTDADSRPHLVPIVFALSGDVLYTAVDRKAKSGATLRRLLNIAVNPAVTALADHYDDDWSRLWWARADGTAQVAAGADAARALELLAQRYEQYRDAAPPGPVIAIDVDRWSGWSAADLDR